jgi:hypothetical protein
MTSDEFMRCFRRSARRLEQLPQYNPRTDAAFAHWQRTGQLLPLEERPAKRAWMALIADAVAEGKRLEVVRVVSHPRTAYEDFELAQYPENVAAGQTVRVANRGEHPELGESNGDFWLMDDDTDSPFVLLMHYDADGQFLADYRMDHPGLIATCRRHLALATACSVPLEDYLVSR